MHRRTLVIGDDKHVRWRRHAERAAADPRYVNPMRPNAAFLAVDAALSDEDVARLEAAPAVAQLSEAWVDGPRRYRAAVTVRSLHPPPSAW